MKFRIACPGALTGPVASLRDRAFQICACRRGSNAIGVLRIGAMRASLRLPGGDSLAQVTCPERQRPSSHAGSNSAIRQGGNYGFQAAAGGSDAPTWLTQGI